MFSFMSHESKIYCRAVYLINWQLCFRFVCQYEYLIVLHVNHNFLYNMISVFEIM